MSLNYSNNVRQRLITAAREAPSGSLDEKIWHDLDLMLFLLGDSSAYKKINVDVPVDRIVALGRTDFWQLGDTWRTGVEHLECAGWTDEIFEYFTRPIRGTSFPAPYSRYEMRLSCVGGLCVVDNGNHRAVAGRAWLTALHAESAKWQKVRVRYEAISIALRELLMSAINKKSGLRVANANRLGLSSGGFRISRIFALSAHPMEVYGLSEGKLFSLKLPCFARFHKNIEKTYLRGLDWRELPLGLVVRLLDDDWIVSQVDGAETWV